MPAQLPPGVRKLFSEPNFAYLATLMPDGSPQVTPIWVSVEGDHIWVNTAEGRTKPENVRRDPRVAVAVLDEKRPYTWAQVRGRVVETRHEGAVEHINRLSQSYVGRDYPLPEGMQRVILVIEPEHVSFAVRPAPGQHQEG